MSTIKQNVSKFTHHLESLPDDKRKEIRRILSGDVKDIFPALWSEGLQEILSVPPGSEAINRKGAKESDTMRNEGNRLYKAKLFKEALLAYNYAILLAPHPNTADFNSVVSRLPFETAYKHEEFSQLAFAYANRSALLIEMEKFDLALQDAEDALQFGYTYSKQYKMMERKIKCYINLHQFDNARKLIENLQSDVNSINLEAKEKSALISSLDKYLRKCSNIKESCDKSQPNTAKTGRTVVIPDSRHSKGKVSNAVAVRASSTRGRHLIAKRHILPG